MSRCKIVKQERRFILCENGQKLPLQAGWFPERVNDSYQQITLDHVLQYMTSMEADLALLNYFRALRVGGEICIDVPDADFFMKKWMQAEWTESDIRDNASECRQAFAGLWGEQTTGNPRNDIYSAQHRDVFKSAYNKKRLTFLLQRAGFVDVEIASVHKGVLSAKAYKSMNKGERQVATDYSNIRQDHKNRYQFACEQLSILAPEQILDCACGIGYGSLMLSKATDAKVTGVDIDSGAISYAKQYFSNDNTQFVCQDARSLGFADASYDAIISFETIEHVGFDKQLLQTFYQLLKPEGVFICSTPNQDVMPFDPEEFKYHLKHYTNVELTTLLTDCGFKQVELFMQEDPVGGKVVTGETGSFSIALCRK